MVIAELKLQPIAAKLWHNSSAKLWRKARPNQRQAAAFRGQSKLKLSLVSLAIALLYGCTQPHTQEFTPPTQKAVLRVSVAPTRSIPEQKKMIAPLEAHLEKSLGQPVEFVLAKSYQDNIDMLLDGRANAAYIGAMSYLEALERGAKVQPLVAPIDKFNNRPWYRSCILVPANSSIRTLEDLKGKRVAFVNPLSTSGYLVPLAALKQRGIVPERDFATLVFGGTHSKTEALLDEGKVDAIATNIPSYNKRKLIDPLTPKIPRVLWESAPIPHTPFLVSRELSPDFIDKLKEAFLTVPSSLPDIFGTESQGYTLVIASDYNPIQNLRIQLHLAAESKPQ